MKQFSFFILATLFTFSLSFGQADKKNGDTYRSFSHSNTQTGMSWDAFPNPFSTSTVIAMKAEIPDYVSVQIYNLQGIKVADLFEGVVKGDNPTTVEWTPEQVTPGMYFVRIYNNCNKVFTKKVMYVRE